MVPLTCIHCGKPIVLPPNAAEIAAGWGMTLQHYQSIFTAHSQCSVNKYHSRTASKAVALCNVALGTPPPLPVTIKP